MIFAIVQSLPGDSFLSNDPGNPDAVWTQQFVTWSCFSQSAVAKSCKRHSKKLLLHWYWSCQSFRVVALHPSQREPWLSTRECFWMQRPNILVSKTTSSAPPRMSGDVNQPVCGMMSLASVDSSSGKIRSVLYDLFKAWCKFGATFDPKLYLN